MGKVMEEYLIVDRIEGKVAVCEIADLVILSLPLSLLPKGVQEGAVLVFDGESFVIDVDAQKTRNAKIKKKMDELFVD